MNFDPLNPIFSSPFIPLIGQPPTGMLSPAVSNTTSAARDFRPSPPPSAMLDCPFRFLFCLGKTGAKFRPADGALICFLPVFWVARPRESHPFFLPYRNCNLVQIKCLFPPLNLPGTEILPRLGGGFLVFFSPSRSNLVCASQTWSSSFPCSS